MITPDPDDYNPDPPVRTKLGVIVLVALLHVVVILGLIRAFAPDFTAKAVEKVLSTFSVTITAPPPPPPAQAPKAAGDQGAAGKKAVPAPTKAPEPKVPIAKVPAPRASSTGSAVTSGATSQGSGTGAGGIGISESEEGLRDAAERGLRHGLAGKVLDFQHRIEGGTVAGGDDGDDAGHGRGKRSGVRGQRSDKR